MNEMPKQPSEVMTYDKHLYTPVPEWLHARIKRAAAREMTSINAWMRASALAKLRIEGENEAA
jgi:predicted HicB family RNase H-like nuclease